MNNINNDLVATNNYINQKQFICDTCNKRFFTKIHYQVHSIIHLLPEHFNCHRCQEGFVHIYSLDKHLEKHTIPMCFVCHVCEKEFFDIDSLNEHVKDHNSEFTNEPIIIKQEIEVEETPLKINNNEIHSSCHNERGEQYKTEEHNSRDNLESLFKCDRCKREFSEKYLFDEHYKNICIKNELDSDEVEELQPLTFTAVDDFHISDDDEKECSHFYFNESSEKCTIENYISNDSLQTLFICDRCKREFPDKHHLNVHQQSICIKKELDSDKVEEILPVVSEPLFFNLAEGDNVALSEVSQTIKNVNTFTGKVQDHQNDNINIGSQNFPKIKEFACEVCQKVFSNKISLIVHSSKHSKQKTFNCYLCKKKFALNCLLHAHMQIHKKKFCFVCQNVFDSKVKLIKHICTHSVKKSFTCNVCLMKFSEKSSLVKHSLDHITEKHDEYKCCFCSCKFSSEALLNVHQHTHLTLAPYFCDVCSKEFSRSDKLLRHYLIHTGEKPYKCETCGKHFRQKSYMTKHFNQVHGPNVSHVGKVLHLNKI